MSRTATELDVQVAKDRLRGNGAWNGQGLLVHLALTSEKDSSRSWMEPLAELCKKVTGTDVVLDDEEASQLDQLTEYAKNFQSALEQ